MKEFYIEFKAWKEGSFEIPWEFWRLNDIIDYRHRNNLKLTVSEAFLQNIFLSFNESKINDFLLQYIAADALGIICSADKLEDAVQEIEKYFGTIELIGHIELNEVTKQRLKEKMGSVKT